MPKSLKVRIKCLKHKGMISKEEMEHFLGAIDEELIEVIPHAKWIPEENPIDWEDGKRHFECSNCGIYHAPKKCERYCPYCGAKMDKE